MTAIFWCDTQLGFDLAELNGFSRRSGHWSKRAKLKKSTFAKMSLQVLCFMVFTKATVIAESYPSVGLKL